MWRHHHVPRDECGVRGSVIRANQVQAQIDAGARTGTRGHIAVVHIQPIRLHPHPRKLPRQLPGPRPVRRGGTVVQQSGPRQREHPRTYGDQPRPTVVRADQRSPNRGRQRRLHRQPARNDHRVRGVQGRQTPGDRYRIARGRGHLARRLRAHLELVVLWHPIPVGTENLHGTTEFEGRLHLPHQCHHTMHGKNIPLHVISDTVGDPGNPAP